MTLERLALLRKSPVFAHLDDAFLGQLARSFSRVVFEAGEPIVAQGAPATSLLLFETGEATVVRHATDGSPRIVGRLGHGDLLGQTALNHSALRSADVVASTEVVAWMLNLRPCEVLDAASPSQIFALLRGLADGLCARLRALDGRILVARGGAAEVSSGGGLRSGPEGLSRPAHGRWAHWLSLLPSFQAVPADVVTSLLPFVREWTLPPGAVVFEEGAPGASCFVTVRGSVDVSVQRGGTKWRLGTFGPGRLFGELSLLDGGPRSATCTIREAATILELERGAFQELRHAFPASAEAVLRVLNHAMVDAAAAAWETLARISPGDSIDVPVAEMRSRVEEPTFPEAEAVLWAKIRAAQVGGDAVFEGPFGPRRVVFADHLGGARPLSFIEHTLYSEILPQVGNAGPTPRGLGLRTMRLREEARQVVREALGAGPGDVVRFTGHGALGALDDLLRSLGVRDRRDYARRRCADTSRSEDVRPVVFLSNDLSESLRLRWHHSAVDVVETETGPDGLPDLGILEEQLAAYAHRTVRVGCFPRVSARTGLLLDDIAINVLLHRHGAIAAWDVSGVLADQPVRLREPIGAWAGEAGGADVLLVDPSACPGGVGCPGVVVGRPELLADVLDAAPDEAGSQGPWLGLPDHASVIRTALVLQLQRAVSAEAVAACRSRRMGDALAAWSDVTGLRVHGPVSARRLATVCLSVRGLGEDLPASLVMTMLDDVFGIQVREVEGSATVFAVDISYLWTDTVFSYVLEAVRAVAEGAWRLAPHYTPNGTTWRLADWDDPPTLCLSDFRYNAGTLEFHGFRSHADDSVLAAQLQQGQVLLSKR